MAQFITQLAPGTLPVVLLHKLVALGGFPLQIHYHMGLSASYLVVVLSPLIAFLYPNFQSVSLFRINFRLLSKHS